MFEQIRFIFKRGSRKIKAYVIALYLLLGLTLLTNVVMIHDFITTKFLLANQFLLLPLFAVFPVIFLIGRSVMKWFDEHYYSD